MKIWANTIVNNEENFIWFVIMSVLDYVDRILIWDTGSDDKTVEIIKTIKSKKIEFKEVGMVNPEGFTKMRQKMLEQSKCDWILILDGDEIWWQSSIKKVIEKINKRKEIEGIVMPMVVPAGDIFHLQDEVAGKYQLLGRKGHLSLKAFSKKIPGLHVDWPYGKETYLDENNLPIQQRKNIIFLDTPFLHVTHLERSSSNRRYNKYKYELGNQVSKNFKFPEVMCEECPFFISSPWVKISGIKKFKSYLLTPLRKLKRRLI